jgi:N-sulfoglucosamine sulfohydrolase
MMLKFFLLSILVSSISLEDKEPDLPLPNILWITSEDNSPFAGCYGDDFATTPHMDQFAEKSFLYTHAYANAPVCAPARNTIITGVYANSGGHQHMPSTLILNS